MRHLPPPPPRFAAMRLGCARYWLVVPWHHYGRVARHFWPEIAGVAIAAAIAAAGVVLR